MGEIEIKNALVASVRIFREDHGILTSYVHLDYGGAGQGFGGYNLETKLSGWVSGLLKVFGVDDIASIKGMSCRAEADWGKVYRIGHFLEDRWFDPAEDLFK